MSACKSSAEPAPEPARPACRRWPMASLALVCLGLQFFGQLWQAAVACGVWLVAFLVIAPPSGRRRFAHPKFWGFALLIVLVSGLVLGPADTPLGPFNLSSAGLHAGLKMLLRAALIFSITIWFSVSVTRDEVLEFSRRRGHEAIGRAVLAAFALLPALSAALSRRWSARVLVSPLRARDVLVELVVVAARAGQALPTQEEKP